MALLDNEPIEEIRFEIVSCTPESTELPITAYSSSEAVRICPM